mmetsp:Transcript_11764/g.26845  ORF Transcript_11764/g.26845 Transcript_11764/m.26845 type:complete len:174 (-) Transcript_11764:99-620(-)
MATEEQKVAYVTWAVPEGVAIGQVLDLQTPHGFAIQVQVPEGATVGQQFQQPYYYIPAVSESTGSADPELAVERHVDDSIATFTEGGAEATGGGPIVGEDGASEYFTFEAPIYAVGWKMNVMRSSGEETYCVIQQVFCTALGPQYQVAWNDPEAEGGVQTKIVDAAQLTFVSQ